MNNACVHGTCQDKLNGYSCLCNNGYHGERCEITFCSDVNCENGGKCVLDEEQQGEGEGLDIGFRCECAPDFEGRFCTESKWISL